MELNQILNQLVKEGKFVNIEDVEESFHKYNLSQEDRNKLLKIIYEHNNNLNMKLTKENKHLKAVIDNKSNNNLNFIENRVHKIKDRIKEEEPIKDQALEIDVTFYMESLNKINNVSEMKSFLPSQDNQTTYDIINTILFNLLEERMIIQRLLNSSDCVNDDTESYQMEYNQLNEKINYLKQYLKDLQTPHKTKIKKENKIIFLKTDTGNNCFMSDLSKSIDPHYYNSMKELLESIKYGEFKNVKNFVGNRILVGLSEVRGYQTRVIFKRLRPDLYIVIQGLVKKVDNSQHYRSTLVARHDLYEKQETKILKNILNSQFLEDNDLEYQNIIKFLNTEQKGDSNDRTYQKNK